MGQGRRRGPNRRRETGTQRLVWAATGPKGLGTAKSRTTQFKSRMLTYANIMPSEQSASRELAFAWTATAIACLYCAWLALTLWRHANAFGTIFRNLGVELPKGTRFVVEHVWIYPVLFGILALFAVVKEWIVRDKRMSVMLSFLVMMLGQWAAGALTALYQQPLFEILRRIE